MTFRWMCVAVAMMASPVWAQVDPVALADRIAAAQNEIWPEIVFDVRLDGCRLHVGRKTSGPDPINDVHISWLADYETDPDRVIVNGQRMTDGVAFWVTSSVLFPLRAEVRDRYADDIARYERAEQALTDFFDASSQTDQDYRLVQDQGEALFEARVAGDYGPLLQRNIGWWIEMRAEGGPQNSPFGFADYPPGLILNDDVMSGILRDLHDYRRENCPAPE